MPSSWEDDFAFSSQEADADREYFESFVNDLFQNYSPFASSFVRTQTSFIDSTGRINEAHVQTCVLGRDSAKSEDYIKQGDVLMVDSRIEKGESVDSQIEKLDMAFPSSSQPSYSYRRENSTTVRTEVARKRNVDLIRPLLEKTSGMRAPSVTVARYQLATSGMRKDEDDFSGSELLRPFVGEFIADVTNELEVPLTKAGVPPERFQRYLESAAAEGRYTVHNREDLSQRWMNYAVERQESIDDADARAAVDLATTVVRSICLDSFMFGGKDVTVKSRAASSVGPDTLMEVSNQGNANDYKLYYGISKRLDPEMLEIGSNMFTRLYKQVVESSDGVYVDPEDIRSEPIITSFGKTEVVGSTLSADGKTRIAKNCRAIFPTSPTDYFKKAFLYHDLCEQLQERCPIYGPGFAAARGNDRKVTNLLKRVTAQNSVRTLDYGSNPGNIKIINRDMKHWDSNMKEHMILTGMNLMESLVDKDGLSNHDRAAREVIFDLACDEVLTKLVEHPSGFLVWVSGTLSSGTYVTSTLNSVSNGILCVACVIYIAVHIHKTKSLSEIESMLPEITSVAKQSIICNGDNQLGTDELYKLLGVEFDPRDDDVFFSKVGMKVKVDECGSTEHLSECMFSSRKFLRARGDMYPVRPLETLLKKLYAKPFRDHLEAKLYVRAMMIDFLAIDPIVFHCLGRIDQKIDIDSETMAARLSRAGGSFQEYIRSSMGGDSLSEDDWSEICTELSRHTPNRACIMSLLLRKEEKIDDGDTASAVSRGFMLGDSLFDADALLAKIGRLSSHRPTLPLVAKMSRNDWRTMLTKTDQLAVYLEMGELNKLKVE